ncbi:M23 family metallopeptidase [Paeniglutamicibacter gangotriensis]|uniref:M23 family metallopeptidase n=1 Tax=Paeniglutamicibacter gangotriensis TaxID=254787 RepID=A0A5B0E3D7_9MICC|nr:M23 family metallopeptidase [Paeniglutamicibacter gangotriensis]KAA0973383.1 M23 family metallopeptidase [Paeniglutamicibacter gangotriensis]
MAESKGAGLATATVALFMTPVVVVMLLLVGGNEASSDTGICGIEAEAPVAEPAGNKSVAGFSGKQLKNAAQIMTAASDLKLPVAAQILGVQTAIGESTLKVIDFGDGAGPDSRGLFQQRDNGAWGSYEDRMNPHTSATNFFKVLKTVEGWQDLEPSQAIHRVQRNANPNHYTQFRSPAVQIVKALSAGKLGEDFDEKFEDISPNGDCPDTSPDAEQIGDLGSGEWSSPLPGFKTMTSPFGPRQCPAGASCNSNVSDHKGIDISKKGGASVLAPTDMKITIAEQGQGWKSAYGTYIIAKQVEKPGLVFEFHHMVHGSLKVKVGDTVAAGTPLGIEGTTGNSTGVHLHFQVAPPGTPSNAPTYRTVVDPVPILKSKGVFS